MINTTNEINFCCLFNEKTFNYNKYQNCYFDKQMNEGMSIWGVRFVSLMYEKEVSDTKIYVYLELSVRQQVESSIYRVLNKLNPFIFMYLLIFFFMGYKTKSFLSITFDTVQLNYNSIRIDTHFILKDINHAYLMLLCFNQDIFLPSSK